MIKRIREGAGPVDGKRLGLTPSERMGLKCLPTDPQVRFRACSQAGGNLGLSAPEGVEIPGEGAGKEVKPHVQLQAQSGVLDSSCRAGSGRDVLRIGGGF